MLDKYAPPPRQLPQILRGRTPVTPQQVEETAKNAGQAAKAASRSRPWKSGSSTGRRRCCGCRPSWKPCGPGPAWTSPCAPGDPLHQRVHRQLPEELDEAQLKNRLALALPETAEVEAEIISAQPQQTCVFLVCHKSCSVQVEGALRAMGFAYPAAPSRRSPAQRIAELEERMEKARQSAEQAKQDIAALRPPAPGPAVHRGLLRHAGGEIPGAG